MDIGIGTSFHLSSTGLVRSWYYIVDIYRKFRLNYSLFFLSIFLLLINYSISTTPQLLVSLKAAFLQKNLVGPFCNTMFLLSPSLWSTDNQTVT